MSAGCLMSIVANTTSEGLGAYFLFLLLVRREASQLVVKEPCLPAGVQRVAAPAPLTSCPPALPSGLCLAVTTGF